MKVGHSIVKQARSDPWHVEEYSRRCCRSLPVRGSCCTRAGGNARRAIVSTHRRSETREPWRDTGAARVLLIESAAGALNGSPVRWLSVTDHYDAPIAPTPGNGFIDPNGTWTKISSASIELTEGALDIDGGSLAPKRAISLGKIWNSVDSVRFAVHCYRAEWAADFHIYRSRARWRLRREFRGQSVGLQHLAPKLWFHDRCSIPTAT